jgi:hypothetical protein
MDRNRTRYKELNMNGNVIVTAIAQENANAQSTFGREKKAIARYRRSAAAWLTFRIATPDYGSQPYWPCKHTVKYL